MIRCCIDTLGAQTLRKSFVNLKKLEYWADNLAFDESALYELCTLPLHSLVLFDDVVNNYDVLLTCNTLRKFCTGYTETPSNYMGFPLNDCNPICINRYSSNFQFPILPHITKLNLCRELSEKIMPYIHLYYSLTTLDIQSLSGKFITDSTITQLTNLRKLKIHCYAKDDDLCLIGMMGTSLCKLDLRYNSDLTVDVFRYLTNLKSLGFLNICGTKISKNNIKSYQKLFSNSLLDIFL